VESTIGSVTINENPYFLPFPKMGAKVVKTQCVGAVQSGSTFGTKISRQSLFRVVTILIQFEHNHRETTPKEHRLKGGEVYCFGAGTNATTDKIVAEDHQPCNPSFLPLLHHQHIKLLSIFLTTDTLISQNHSVSLTALQSSQNHSKWLSHCVYSRQKKN